MFSSVGQIVGLIEIEPADSDARLLASLEFDNSRERSDLEASLGELFARLVGEPAAPSGQTSRTTGPPTLRAANRLGISSPQQPVNSVMSADLARLETDLADELRRLREKLSEAEIRSRAR